MYQLPHRSFATSGNPSYAALTSCTKCESSTIDASRLIIESRERLMEESTREKLWLADGRTRSERVVGGADAIIAFSFRYERKCGKSTLGDSEGNTNGNGRGVCCKRRSLVGRIMESFNQKKDKQKQNERPIWRRDIPYVVSNTGQ
jgi:hypothetical protein